MWDWNHFSAEMLEVVSVRMEVEESDKWNRRVIHGGLDFTTGSKVLP
jgi:hypothetical protein